MAPEVIMGGNYSESADIFSFAMVMWELLTGLCPFEGCSPMEVAIAVSQRAARPPISPPPATSVPQAGLLRKCWDTNPLLRPSSSQCLALLEEAFPAL